MAGNGLPQRWAGRERFVILETGFGLGNNFLATWQAWRDDPRRCERLVFVSVESRPLTRSDLAAIERPEALQPLAAQLVERWPPLTPNLHTLVFEEGGVRLLLALGDIEAWLPELVTTVDACCLDGFAPARNPRMWSARVCKALGRLAAPDATLATWSAARAVRAALTSAGFEVQPAAGSGDKRDITLARHAPRFVPRRAPARSMPHVDHRALIVGGGLAGCATAWALAEQGWQSCVIDRHAQPAQEASGNWAGLFHGTVHGDDGTHARFNRAAALMAADVIAEALASGSVRGSTDGLLRLESTLNLAAMRALIERQSLPPEYVQAVDASEASALAGVTLTTPAWLYVRGGWVEPAALARWFLERAAARAIWRGSLTVQALRQRGGQWHLLADDGSTIAAAPNIVLANATDANRLLGIEAWPIAAVRGQISRVESSAGLAGLRLPLAGAGYAIPALDGWLCFGATSQTGDRDAAVRRADHAANLAQAAGLLGELPHGMSWQGRTSWRAVSPDRLPIIGGVPDATSIEAGATRMDQPRYVPRLPGLFVHTALGSRGIGWSALGARLLAALMSGAPAPLEASLIDAVDPARFMSRRHNRAGR